MKYSDLHYGGHERHLVDLYIPDTVKYPEGMIMIIHGGGWNSCDKSVHAKDLEYWYEKGYTVAAINYRYVSSEIHIPDLLDDIELAFSFLKKKLNDEGMNVKKAILTGGSAGAHLCMMYAYTRMAQSAVTPVAVVDYCGPADFTLPGFIMGINGAFEDWKYTILSDCCGVKVTKENLSNLPEAKKCSPLYYIGQNTVPTVLAYGRKDNIVPFNQCEALGRAFEKYGIRYDTVIYENSGHELNKDPEALKKTRHLLEVYAEDYLR